MQDYVDIAMFHYIPGMLKLACMHFHKQHVFLEHYISLLPSHTIHSVFHYTRESDYQMCYDLVSC